jgi:hypothetical protein
VDLNCELLNLSNSAPEGDDARNGKWDKENISLYYYDHMQETKFFSAKNIKEADLSIISC